MLVRPKRSPDIWRSEVGDDCGMSSFRDLLRRTQCLCLWINAAVAVALSRAENSVSRQRRFFGSVRSASVATIVPKAQAIEVGGFPGNIERDPISQGAGRGGWFSDSSL